MVSIAADHLVRPSFRRLRCTRRGFADLLVDGQFFPHHQPQTVRGVHGGRVVRVMGGPPEVHPHGADDFHVQGVARIRERVSHAGVRLVPVRPLHLHTLAVQEKPSLRVEFEPAETQRVFVRVNQPDPVSQAGAKAVDVRSIRRPQPRVRRRAASCVTSSGLARRNASRD